MQAQAAGRIVGGRQLMAVIALAFVLGSALAALVFATVVDRSDAAAPNGIQADNPANLLPDGDIDSEFMRDIRGSESNPGQGEGMLDRQRRSTALSGPVIPSDLMLFLEWNLYLPGDTGTTMSHQDLQQWEWEREQPVAPESSTSRTDNERQWTSGLTNR